MPTLNARVRLKVRPGATASTYTKSDAVESSRETDTNVLVSYGGGSETGWGRSRAGNAGRAGSCAQNWKWITSLAAIIAPHTCDCGQGRVGATNTGASRLLTSTSSWPSCLFFDLYPYPKIRLLCAA
jgi:hypothetical protein